MANNLRKFATLAAYQTEVDNLTLDCPNVSLITADMSVKYLKSNPSTGVGIKTTTGLYYTLAEWNALETKPTALGVYVRSANARFCIGNTVASKTWSDPYGIQIPGCFINSDQTAAKLDYGGVANTDAIMAKINDGTSSSLNSAQAAQYCRSYNFGVSGVTGYLLSLGEIYVMFQNITDVNLCRVALGWQPIALNTWFWSSSQYSTNNAWLCSSGSVASTTKSYSGSVVPACAL